MTDKNTHKNKYTITRFPKTRNQSLQAWNAADEYLLQNVHFLHLFEKLDLKTPKLAIFNDRFGFLACHFYQFSPTLF